MKTLKQSLQALPAWALLDIHELQLRCSRCGACEKTGDPADPEAWQAQFVRFGNRHSACASPKPIHDEAEKLPGCDHEPLPPHPCPFKQEIRDDHETLCTCCRDCMHDCLRDT